MCQQSWYTPGTALGLLSCESTPCPDEQPSRLREYVTPPNAGEHDLAFDHKNPRSLAYLLLYGSPETRRSLAEQLVEEGDSEAWALLAGTARSQESWLLRARCLETLGIAAGQAGQGLAEAILAEVLGEVEVTDK